MSEVSVGLPQEARSPQRRFKVGDRVVITNYPLCAKRKPQIVGHYGKVVDVKSTYVRVEPLGRIDGRRCQPKEDLDNDGVCDGMHQVPTWLMLPEEVEHAD